MNAVERSVFLALQSHRGRENGVNGRRLADSLKLRHRLVCECIESLITTHGIPIGSDPINGYYLIATEDEYRKARHELAARIVALGARIRALESAFRRDIARPSQPELFKDAPPCT